MYTERYVPDYLNDISATRDLRKKIENYWARKGRDVRVWIEKEINPQTKMDIYVIRSNI